MTDQKDPIASELARKRWAKASKRHRSDVAREISNARWDKWRAENPEKAKASEERRKKRSANKARSKKMAGK